MIQTACAACGKVHKLKDQMAGKKGKCLCGAILTIPFRSDPIGTASSAAIPSERQPPAQRLGHPMGRSKEQPASAVMNTEVHPSRRRFVLLGVSGAIVIVAGGAYLLAPMLRANAQTAISPPSPAAVSEQPKARYSGTPAEMSTFGFLNLVEESDLPEHFEGYVRLVAEKATQRMVKEPGAYFRVDGTNVRKTDSLTTPYVGVMSGEYKYGRLPITFTATFASVSERSTKQRGWKLQQVTAQSISEVNGKVYDNSADLKEIILEYCNAAVTDIKAFLDRQK